MFSLLCRPRNVPAVAVIFSERRDMTGTIRKREVHRLYNHIQKRSTLAIKRQANLPALNLITFALQQTESRAFNVLKNAWNSLLGFRKWIAKKMYNRLPRAMKRIVKKIGRIEARIHKKLICTRPRLRRRYGTLVYPEGLTVKRLVDKKSEFIDFLKFGNPEEEEVQYIEDCFADMDRPKFGYSAKITFMENEPCEIDFENPERSTCIMTRSNSNNEDPNGLNRRYFNHYAQSRQTGEGFRSAATPDCRIQLCESQPTQPASQPTLAPANLRTEELIAETIQTKPQPTENLLSASQTASQPATMPTQPAPQPTQPLPQPTLAPVNLREEDLLAETNQEQPQPIENLLSNDLQSDSDTFSSIPNKENSTPVYSYSYSDAYEGSVYLRNGK